MSVTNWLMGIPLNGKMTTPDRPTKALIFEPFQTSQSLSDAFDMDEIRRVLQTFLAKSVVVLLIGTSIAIMLGMQGIHDRWNERHRGLRLLQLDADAIEIDQGRARLTIYFKQAHEDELICSLLDYLLAEDDHEQPSNYSSASPDHLQIDTISGLYSPSISDSVNFSDPRRASSSSFVANESCSKTTTLPADRPGTLRPRRRRVKLTVPICNDSIGHQVPWSSVDADVRTPARDRLTLLSSLALETRSTMLAESSMRNDSRNTVQRAELLMELRRLEFDRELLREELFRLKKLTMENEEKDAFSKSMHMHRHRRRTVRHHAALQRYHLTKPRSWISGRRRTRLSPEKEARVNEYVELMQRVEQIMFKSQARRG